MGPFSCFCTMYAWLLTFLLFLVTGLVRLRASVVFAILFPRACPSSRRYLEQVSYQAPHTPPMGSLKAQVLFRLLPPADPYIAWAPIKNIPDVDLAALCLYRLLGDE